MDETVNAKLADLQRQIDDLKTEEKRDITTHSHDGNNSTRISLDTLEGLFETVSAVPKHNPKTIFDQIKIYSNGTTYQLYWYDVSNNKWRYTTGTTST